MGGGGPQDLYSIGLDPRNGGTTLPGDVSPRGSIGGSDVGANERDDQRVRDLVEQWSIENNLINQITFLNNNRGWVNIKTVHYPSWLIIHQAAVAGAIEISQETHSVIFTDNAKPKMFELSGQLLASFPAPAGSSDTLDIKFQLFIDGAYAVECRFFRLVPIGVITEFQEPQMFRFVFKIGNIAADMTLAEVASMFAAGSHTFNAKAIVANTEWTGDTIDVEIRQFTMAWYEHASPAVVTIDDAASAFAGT